MARTETLDVGVIVERRKLDHPWQEWSWRPVAVVAGAPGVDGWKPTVSGDGWAQFHAATVTVDLHPAETEGYVVALQADPPRLWVVLRQDENGGDFPYKVHIVTMSAYRAQDYMDSAEEIVEAVPMPAPMIAWVEAFVAEHFVAEPFRKRRRDEVKIEELKFGKEPIFQSGSRESREDGDG
jgi:hypothetical protein